MKLIELNNAWEVQDIDIDDDNSCRELGLMVADKCVVFLNQKLDERRLYDIQTLWGTPSRSLIEEYVCEKKLRGSHWRELLASLAATSSAVNEFNDGMTRVSFAKNKRGKPTGLFTNGELDWHSDQQASQQKQRVIGLTSLFGSRKSQTNFLCTANTYEALNHDDKSMVDELITCWEWDGGSMSAELIPSQMEIVRYNMIPLDGMECPLVDQTASGRKGIKFPSHCFRGFRGMSREESLKVRADLWNKLNHPDNIYIRNWQDGQTVFMDQNITLHARPTNVKDGDTRTMARMVSYMDRLFPNQQKNKQIMWNGQALDRETLLAKIDQQREKEFMAKMEMNA